MGWNIFWRIFISQCRFIKGTFNFKEGYRNIKATGRFCQIFEAFIKNLNFQKGCQLIVKGLSAKVRFQCRCTWALMYKGEKTKWRQSRRKVWKFWGQYIHRYFDRTCICIWFGHNLWVEGIPPCSHDSDGSIKKEKMKTLCAKPIRIVRSILGKLPTKHSKFKAPQLCFGS